MAVSQPVAEIARSMQKATARENRRIMSPYLLRIKPLKLDKMAFASSSQASLPCPQNSFTCCMYFTWTGGFK